ncbi:hypothetical protein GW17_00011144 [Ensete ventricosum]|nr:hypothetical protein GW17_00011144 [Ensete ventricosum]
MSAYRSVAGLVRTGRYGVLPLARFPVPEAMDLCPEYQPREKEEEGEEKGEPEDPTFRGARGLLAKASRGRFFSPRELLGKKTFLLPVWEKKRLPTDMLEHTARYTRTIPF